MGSLGGGGRSPIAAEAFLGGAELVAGGGESLPSRPVVIAIFTTTATLPTPVPIAAEKIIEMRERPLQVGKTDLKE